MVNWTALLGTELGVKVRRTTRSWIVHIEVIRDRNSVEVANLAVNLDKQKIDSAISGIYGLASNDIKAINEYYDFLEKGK